MKWFWFIILSLQIGKADPGGGSFTECSAHKFLTRFILFRDRVTDISLDIKVSEKSDCLKVNTLGFLHFCDKVLVRNKSNRNAFFIDSVFLSIGDW